MLDLKHVQTFVAITEAGSFSAAAELLDVAQPTVSGHIKMLEQELGFALFDRIGKYAVLSSAGKTFATHAAELLRLAVGAYNIEQQAQAVTGQVSVCIVESVGTYGMAPFLKAFNTDFPNVRLDVSMSRPSTYMLSALREGEFDAAIVFEAPFDIPALATQTLWYEALTICAPNSHAMARQPITLQQLASQPLLLPEQGAHYRRLLERWFSDRKLEPLIVHEIHSMELLKRSVKEGLGVALLPMLAVKTALAQAELVPLQLTEPLPQMRVQLIWHRMRKQSRAVRSFLEYVKTFDFEVDLRK